MSTTVTYKGSTLTTVSNDTATLETAGTWMEDDLTLVDVSQSTPVLQTKSETYTPSTSQQTDQITADVGYDGLDEVNITVNAVPTMTLPSATSSTSSGTSKATVSRSTSDQYLNIPTGYNGTAQYYKISATPNGTATPASSISATGATVSAGTNTLTLSKSVSNTPQVSAGYISSGTAGNSSVSLTASVNTRDSSDLSASGATVTAPAGYYGSSASKTVASGTEGTPSATKGTVNNHSVSVTPSVTNTTGWITGSTKTGTAVTVSASELVSGNKEITSNGSNIDVTDYATVSVNVSGGGGGAISVVDTTDSGGGTIRTITAVDTSSVTAVASDVASGKYFIDSSGTLTAGTASGGGGISVDDLILKNGATSISTDLASGTLRDYLFYGSTSLQSIEMLNYVGMIPSNAFRSCTALTNVKLPKATSSGSNVFQGCTSLTVLVLQGITSGMGTDTIRGCTSLTAVDLNAPSTIGANFFNGNTLMTTLVLRKSSVISLGNINAFASTPFASDGSGGTIYVPNDLINTYKSSSNWSTLNGYGTVTWAKIEDSYYETHYADGTVIS